MEIEREEFEVEIPRCAGFAIGDVVEPMMDVSLSGGFLLGTGVVVKIDEDDSQELIPLFFIRGAKTQIRSVLGSGSLRKIDTHDEHTR